MSEKYLSDNDPTLAKIIQTVTLAPIESTNNVYHDLMSCVLEQQIHYRSTKKIFQKCLEKANLIHVSIENFPILEEKSFGTLKLAVGKFETLERINAFFAANKLDWQDLSDDEVTAHLSGIKGIGKWTIDMILLYTLQRPNVFPYDDFHLKQIMVAVYGLDERSKLKAQMLEVASQWGEHKSLAVRYLLATKKSQR